MLDDLKGLQTAWAGRVLVVLVAAGAIVVAVDATRMAGHRAREAEPAAQATALAGPDVPQPRALLGTLVALTAGSCRLQVIDLSAAVLGASTAAPGCDLWMAPTGQLAVVPRQRRRGGYEAWLASLGDEVELVRRLGTARGRPAWSPAGDAVAWCSATGDSEILQLETGAHRTLPGCQPRILADGSVLTATGLPRPPRLLRDARPLLDEDDLLRGFGGPRPDRVALLGFDGRADGLLAVCVAGFGNGRPEIILELWRERTLLATAELPLRVVPGIGALGELVRFSPSGDELAIGLPRTAFGLMVIDVDSLRVVRALAPSRGFAWSPDGRWLAISTRRQILIAGTVREETVYAIPLSASSISWRNAA